MILTGLQLRIAGYLVAVLGLFVAGAYWQHGRDARKAAVVAAAQAQRDAIAATTYAKAVQERAAAEKAAIAANARIYADLEPKLAAAVADGRDLARRLRDALQARARADAAAAHPDQPGTADSPGVPSGQSAIGSDIERATGDALAACSRDSDRLAALQAEVIGQLSSP